MNFPLSLKLLLPGNPITLWGHSWSLPAAAVSNSASLVMQAPSPRASQAGCSPAGKLMQKVQREGRQGTGGGKLEWRPLGHPHGGTCAPSLSYPLASQVRNPNVTINSLSPPALCPSHHASPSFLSFLHLLGLPPPPHTFSYLLGPGPYHLLLGPSNTSLNILLASRHGPLQSQMEGLDCVLLLNLAMAPYCPDYSIHTLP